MARIRWEFQAIRGHLFPWENDMTVGQQLVELGDQGWEPWHMRYVGEHEAEIHLKRAVPVTPEPKPTKAQIQRERSFLRSRRREKKLTAKK